MPTSALHFAYRFEIILIVGNGMGFAGLGACERKGGEARLHLSQDLCDLACSLNPQKHFTRSEIDTVIPFLRKNPL